MATEGSSSGDASNQITFNIKSSSDSRHTVTIADTATVSDLKQKLSTKEYADIPVDRQRLIYSGRVMKDPDTLATYKIKDGNTVHLVKGAASNQQRNPETAGQSQSGTGSQVPPNAGVPQNLATGTGADPLAGLTGARYAGFAQMPGAGMFGPDGGMGAPQGPEDMLNMLENPMVQAQFNEAMNNPHVIQMLQNNPMIRDQPMMREMLNNPEFRRMMFDPQFIRTSMQMSRMMGGGARGAGGGGGDSGGMPAPGVTDMTPQPQSDQASQGSATPSQTAAPGQESQTQQSTPNPFGMAGGGQQNPFAMLSALGGMNPMGQAQPSSTNSTPGNDSQNRTTTSTTNQPLQQPQQPPNPFAGMFGQHGQQGQQGQGQQRNPFMEMAQRMMQDPQMMQYAMNSLGGMGGPPTTMNPPNQQQQQGGQQEQQQQQQQQQANPFAALFNPAFGGLSGMGGFGVPPQQQQEDTRPPEELYADQLRTLNEMGLHDFQRNVRALRMSGGNVQAAVELLFSGSI